MVWSHISNVASMMASVQIINMWDAWVH